MKRRDRVGATLLLGCATMADPENTRRCVTSMVEQNDNDPWDVSVVCNSERVEAECKTWEARGVNVLWFLENIGTCRSWNMIIVHALERGYNGAFIVGDDVAFSDTRGLSHMEAMVTRDPTMLYFVKGLGFSGFCVTRYVWDKVGAFDSGFWPAYFEDNDYHWRAKHAGVKWADVQIPVTHVGSGSLKAWKEWEDYNANRAFVTNQRRYVEKWGGGPGQERWAEPWHGCPERAWNTKDWLRMAGWNPPWPDPFFQEAHSGALR